MHSYNYKGRDTQGALISGQMSAQNEDAVASYLSKRSIIPLDISVASVTDSLFDSLKERFETKEIKLVEQIFFCRQMYTLLRAGIPIMKSLEDLRDSTPCENLKHALGELHADLDSGQELSTAIRKQPKSFPPLFASIIAVGEETGNLDECFALLAVYFDKERELRNSITSALRYPIIVCVAILAAIGIINMLVIPAFANIFNSFNAELPWTTRLLVASSGFMLNYWPYMLVTGIATFSGLKYYAHTPDGRLLWHKLKLKIPLVGDIIFRSLLGRFANTLSLCIKSGIPWGAAITVSSKATDNEHIAKKIIDIKDSIEQGENITNSFKKINLFPPLVIQMVHVGEETGALDKLLSDVGEYFEREVSFQLKRLSDSLEPILITIVGVMVLILALGVFLPMWDLGSAALK